MPSPLVVVVAKALRAPHITPSVHSFDSTSSHCAWSMLPVVNGPPKMVMGTTVLSLLRRLKAGHLLLHALERSLFRIEEPGDLAAARVADAGAHQLLVGPVELDVDLSHLIT